MPLLELREHTSSSYVPRTVYNAHTAHLTVAFAVDFTTAGERLTAKTAPSKYVAVPIDRLDPYTAAIHVYREAVRLDARHINVAGNGIYTLAEHGWSQERINDYVTLTLSHVDAQLRSGVAREQGLSLILSGGQTGADLAGLVAAVRLGIPAVGTLPAGFKQRGLDRKDVSRTREDIEAEILAFSAQPWSHPPKP